MKKFRRNTINLVTVVLLATALPEKALSAEAKSDEIVVTATAEKEAKALAAKRAKTSDTAALLGDTPGVSLATGGGVSSLPVVHGLADDRIMITLDGCCVTSACANHMNPPLSYFSPAKVGTIAVKTAVSPVSEGGDNIGGIIVVESDPPLFSEEAGNVRAGGSVSGYYRSNNSATGASFSASAAGKNVSFGVTGSIDHADDYHDGHGDKVTSTYYESRNVGMTLGVKGESSLLTVKAGHQEIPEQGFVNQWMDMTGNTANYLNASWQKGFGWGKLDAKAYWQNTWHSMNSGKDKVAHVTMMPDMPMETHGIDIGYSLKTDIDLNEKNILRLGHEFHRFTLDDWWPPIYSKVGTMGPDTFLNINDGRRDRYAFFAEWEGKLSDRVTGIFGVRNEQVRMDTGDVQGYNNQNVVMGMMGSTTTNYLKDSEAFNALDHERNDSNWDITALLKFEPDALSAYEVGYARKTRSPNLYERYAWSTFWMCSGMVNWFGDGNGYVGNLDLEPEVAHTVSFTAGWHDSGRKTWELKVTPYYTYISDYIGVKKIGEKLFNVEKRNILQFDNHDAEIYGIDLSGMVSLWNSEGFGSGQLRGVVGYVHGRDLDNGTNLYHMMPLNGLLTLEQSIKGWTNAVEVQLVGSKTLVDDLRLEPETEGYTLVNIRTSYQWKNLRIDAGVTNLFDAFHHLPLGGINYDNFLFTKPAGQIYPLAGMGRSFNIGVTQSF
ncbi:MAG: TonB-dependent receptor [Chlorobiaceae bacterium]|nr:TonB-dependent receptor [Chlorobiaceae bacterium]NTV60755.1 TonB-dependent receptor [Chlorobiaceae bacterium]